MEMEAKQQAGGDRMISFLQFFGGYCKVSIKGKGKERFLNLCRNKKLLLWNLSRQEEGYSFFISFRAHRYLKEMEEKTNTEVRIEGTYGLPFFLSKHRRRKMLFAGFFLCLLTIYILSCFLWKIEVRGTEKYTEDEIKVYLEGQKIREGILKKKIDCSWLEEKIREDFEDTAWVSCDLSGTMLTIHIKESIDTAATEKKEEIPNDIVAFRDGVIESIVTRSGTPLVKKGNEVKKGDVLISGIIYIYNEFDELLETGFVSADGDVKALTKHEYEETFPLQYYEKEYTDRTKKAYQPYLGKRAIPFFSPKVSYENFDTVEKQHVLKIGPSFYLPFSVTVTTYQEYTPKMIHLSEEQAKKKAEQKIQDYLNILKKEGKEIRKKEFHLTFEEENCQIKGTVTVMESIGKIRNIP